MGAERGQHDPWTPELVAHVTAERRKRLPLERWDERVAWRDRWMRAVAATLEDGDDSPGGLASLGGVARGARPPAEPRDELAVALDALARFARGFALLYERAVLLRRLRTQHEELRQVASWADARSSELADSAIDLAHDREAPPARRPPAAPRVSALLTPRELDVLEQMARGVTNAEIARALVVSEGTVKFHVKNVLRKLNVSNRAEATAHYLRDSLRASP
jgi:DNA-binding CsgD family transcriptional regulator